MSLRITITITGDQIVYQRVQRLGASIYNLRAAMVDIGMQATNYYRTIGFTDRGRPWGEPWPNYSPKYMKWKEKHFPGTPMLVRGGDKSQHMQENFFATATATSVTIDNRASYYKYHQSTKEHTKMPFRPMAGINNVIKGYIRQSIRDDIRRKIAGA